MAVTPNDIAVELGRPTPTSVESAQWGSWIEQARYLIGKRLGDINILDPADVDYVVLQAVAAHVRRPDDSTQVDIAIDDGRMSKRYESGAGRVTILDEWWDLLTPDGTGYAGAFTIAPAGSVDRLGDGPMGWVR
jgi:hypothetical protein